MFIRIDNKEKAKVYFGRVALIVALIFILWQAPAVTKLFEFTAVSVSGFLWKIGAYTEERVSAIKIFFEHKQKLADENEELQNTLQFAYIKMLSHEELERENEELKKLLGRDADAVGILGTVLSRPNRSPYDTFLLDVGSEHGVRAGSLVIFKNVLLGVIDTVYARAAKARLFSSPGTELQVVLGSGRIPAIAEGQGGGVFEIKIPRDIKINEGDLILYQALQNYLVGMATRVEVKPESSFQKILFRAPINIFTARFVIVTPDLMVSIEKQ